MASSLLISSRDCRGMTIAVEDKLVGESIEECQYVEPRLVAVSKFKPVDLIIEAYEAGQRNFGENYVNELVEKASNPNILSKCKDIQWHFIGHLQRNKVNKVVDIPNLYMIETVDNDKLALTINNAWLKFRKCNDSRLKIMVQVNTSQEEEKSGCEAKDAPSLVKYVIENCLNLEFVGLMTIGQFGYDITNGPNPDFICLKQCRDDICQTLGLMPVNVQLSMGMSNDYEHAIEVGSTSVRVGTAIFGERDKKPK